MVEETTLLLLRKHGIAWITIIVLIAGMGGLVSDSDAQNNGPAALPSKIAAKDRICFALYTVHDRVLKLTAQFYPINDYEPFEAKLEIRREGNWIEVQRARIRYPGYTATFRIDTWDDSQAHQYRVVHNDQAYYGGVVQANPKEKSEFVVAAFSCNSIYKKNDGDIPRTDIVDNLKRIKPDLLFFAGDQVYDHSEHYLHWLKFGRDFGEVIRNTPTVCLPDDHDIGQGNLWGSGGKRARTRNGQSGGYYMPVEYVQEVERAQTSHLPDAFDPTPIENGIGVYYTALTWGGISFAIIEDRKFKTGPLEVGEKPVDRLNSSQAKLLGERQLKFLEQWVTDWRDAEIKTVLSQTIFASSTNYIGQNKRKMGFDFDSNGWPKRGRDKALSVIRKGYACMIGGDTHLGSVIHHGIEDWNDAGVSFCTPAIANFWLRWWEPTHPGRNRQPDSPDYTGEFLDGFKNKITVYAVANPAKEPPGNQVDPQEKKLTTRAAGFGVVRYDKTKRRITFECWPRNVDISQPSARQYPGWPITISQLDNCQFTNGFQLPALELDLPDQVVTVRSADSNEVITSLRVKGTNHQPRVPRAGQYHIDVGEANNKVTLENLVAEKSNRKTLDVDSSK